MRSLRQRRVEAALNRWEGVDCTFIDAFDTEGDCRADEDGIRFVFLAGGVTILEASCDGGNFSA